MSLLGIGALGGFGVRSVMGLRDMAMAPTFAPSYSANLPHPITIYGQSQHQPEERMMKRAELPQFMQQAGSAISNAAQQVPQMASDAMQSVGDAVQHVPKMIAPHLPEVSTLRPLMSEWGMPAGLAALGGGAYGGYKLTDWLLGKQKDIAGANEVSDAEEEYRQALAEQYRAAMLAKSAGDDLGINDLADQYAAQVAEQCRPKLASQSIVDAYVPGSARMYSNLVGGHDNWQAMKGVANSAIMLATLGSGKLMYDLTKGHNKQELLQKALKLRQLQRQQWSPPPIVALPEETRIPNAA